MNKVLRLAVPARLLILGSLLLLFGTAGAATPMDADRFDAFVETYLLAESGASLVDVDQLESDIEAALPGTDSVFLSGGNLSPIAKALHALEIHDGALERVRYAVGVERVSVEDLPASDPVPVLLITVQRYNLGQVIREELIGSIGEENVAEPEEFGVGAHVEWRFVTRQLMGHEAMLLAASRRDLGHDEAAAAGCLGGGCLSTASLIDSAAVWHDFFPADLGFTFREFLEELPYEARSADGLPVSAAALDLAARLAGFDAYLAEISGTGGLGVFAAVERNLGQDLSLDVVLVQADLADDSLASVWTRVYGFATGGEDFPLLSAQAYECRRGEAEFAPVGDFCP